MVIMVVGEGVVLFPKAVCEAVIFFFLGGGGK